MTEEKLDKIELIPLSKEEALASMLLFGEVLTDDVEPACSNLYKWNGWGVILLDDADCIFHNIGRVINDLPKLYRQGVEGDFFNMERKNAFCDPKSKSPDVCLCWEAIVFAVRKHNEKKRKGSDIPYIYHPMETMQILFDQISQNDIMANAMIAGVLHDVLEDTDTTPDEIINKFGEKIYNIINEVTEDKSKTWKERKQATIEHLPTASIEAKFVCCADKLSNLYSMADDLDELGEKLWERFNASKKDIEWYYRGVLIPWFWNFPKNIFNSIIFLIADLKT
jgi:myo-inositol-1(or 4)-monophosphatase